MTYTEAPVALPTPQRGREDHEAEEAEHPPRPQHGPREGRRRRQQESELRYRERPPPAATATTATAIASPEGALEAANDKSIDAIDGMSEVCFIQSPSAKCKLKSVFVVP